MPSAPGGILDLHCSRHIIHQEKGGCHVKNIKCRNTLQGRGVSMGASLPMLMRQAIKLKGEIKMNEGMIISIATVTIVMIVRAFWADIVIGILCFKHGIPMAKVIFTNISDEIRGEYDPSENKIYINTMYCRISNATVVMATLLHEFRHHYQNHRYHEVYQWFHEHRDYYEFTYAFDLNLIEEDARVYGFSYGCRDREDLFLNPDALRELKMMYYSFTRLGLGHSSSEEEVACSKTSE